MKRGAFLTAAAAGVLSAAPAWAGPPTDGGLNLRTPATKAMHEIVDFHNFLLPIIIVVSLFVLALLLWVIVRYNSRANPTPKKFTHNMLVEVIWTVVPVLILVVIAWRSFPILAHQELTPRTEMTIKVTGNSWYWQYEYVDMGVNVTSNLLPESDAAAQNRPYLLAVDNPIVVPVGVNVELRITSSDVIHSWTVPQFGVKQDAIPGRVNVGWFNIDPEFAGATFYGQCSELCGINHAFMPIEVRAVTRAEFEAWLAQQGGSMAQAEPAAAPGAAPPEPTTTAPAQPAAAGAAPTR